MLGRDAFSASPVVGELVAEVARVALPSDARGGRVTGSRAKTSRLSYVVARVTAPAAGHAAIERAATTSPRQRGSFSDATWASRGRCARGVGRSERVSFAGVVDVVRGRVGARELCGRRRRGPRTGASA